MEIKSAITAFASLSQETRLSVFRRLIKAGETGLSAGALAEDLAVAPPTMSFHLKELTSAGLARFERDGRRIIYYANLDGVRALVDFLVSDCCGQRPELCGPYFTAKTTEV